MRQFLPNAPGGWRVGWTQNLRGGNWLAFDATLTVWYCRIKLYACPFAWGLGMSISYAAVILTFGPVTVDVELVDRLLAMMDEEEEADRG